MNWEDTQCDECGNRIRSMMYRETTLCFSCSQEELDDE